MKTTDFDKATLRKNTNSFKWKALNSLYGDENLYPMWVADMEFEVSPAIQKRIQERVDEAVYGYELLSPQYDKAVQYWLRKRHGYAAEKEWIVYCSTVMTGLSVVLQAMTEKGDEVMIHTPVYGNFFSVIKGCQRKVKEIPLLIKEERWTFDMEKMERDITSRTKVLLVCNPHNPVGRVWDEEELSEIILFCKKHHLLLISDEVHYDFIFEGKHTMVAAAAKKSHIPLVTLISPGKTFNVAGIQTATMIIEDESIRNRVCDTMRAMAYPFEHAFAEAVTIGGYLESEQWLEELLEYLKKNRMDFEQYFRENLPELKVVHSQATYLMWVDCSGLQLADEELHRFWIEDCHLALSDGREFGAAGRQHVRFNIACDRASMMRALEQIRISCERRR